jgi:hypothetical protein
MTFSKRFSIESLDSRKYRPLFKRQRILKDRFNPYEELDELSFITRYRLSKQCFIELLNLIQTELKIIKMKKESLPPIIQLAIVLRFYATGQFQITEGDLHGIHQSTVSRLVKKVSIAIAKPKSNFIKFPSIDERSEIKLGFHLKARMPGVYGLIDCKHVNIQRPQTEDSEVFRNRKGHFSINVQVICDNKSLIRNIVARWYGSAHDSRIFRESKIFRELESEPFNGYLLGDAGYPCLPFCMTPLRNPITEAENRYNVSHVQTRNGIERLFGQWQRRFWCLFYLRIRLDRVFPVIIATAILHNMCKTRNIPLLFESLNFIDQELLSSNNENSDYISNNRETLFNVRIRSGTAIRKSMIERNF